MFKKYPEIGKPLKKEHIDFLKTFAKSCRRSIIEMTANAGSGHPGGSLSSIDYLSLLYAFILGQTGEKLVVSNGHISPAVYSTLAEMGYISKQDVTANFRKAGHIYDGHVSRHVPGIWYGTGPLGIGVSVGAAFALAEKIKGTNKKVFCIMGDGECQEGQVHEMIHFSRTHKLNNLILFVDNNKVQLTASINETLQIDIPKIFEAGHWHIIKTDGHDFAAMWNTLAEAYAIKNKPVVIIGDTYMGQGIDFMEKDGRALKSDWHGKPPKPEQIETHLKNLKPTDEEEALLAEFRKTIKWKPEKAKYPPLLSKVDIDTGKPITYTDKDDIDCRNAYGKALLDLAHRNKTVLALSADLRSSVMTKYAAEEFPAQHIECGIAEQHMVSTAGGLSLDGFVPFCSTFGAFMSSRAKDQARVNDINYCNVKMVSSHCGLSVGEDGPTHQAIDDMNSFFGMFNTMTIEPADPNQTDHIIRYIASHYGNFYVRMGRHKFPIITKKDGSPFYDENYRYGYGRSDIIREGTELTIAVSGSLVVEALKAHEELKRKISVEVVAVTSPKKFDQTLINSIKKTRKVLTVEDHNVISGYGSQLATYLQKEGIQVESFKSLGTKEYQLSGKSQELYHIAGLDAEGIVKVCL